ncbi:DUF588 domain-containing protein [Cephalotus follicularis]|uniref:CASP-like protein n=1 Tax=Cephalotus follicularis TaxID=3775 RepID=A0A1Q3AV29_CEPFO|nr:DUF588 domain-containing protein [Cephalotus follicularis]
MERWILRCEVLFRFCAMWLLVLSACLEGLAAQRKVIYGIDITARYKDLQSLEASVYISSVAAAYNLLQLSRCLARLSGNSKGSYRYLAWTSYLLDQIAVYIVFGVCSAALAQSVLVLTGVEAFLWLKWCGKFTRFCFQIGGALACGYVACVAMILVSVISAYNLFRLYSPKKFLLLKAS